METRYVTITVRTNKEQEQRPAPRKRRKHFNIAPVVMSLVLFLVIGMGAATMQVKANQEVVLVEDGLTKNHPDAYVGQRHTADKVKVTTALAAYTCAVKEDNVEEEPVAQQPEAIEAAEEVVPAPTIDPISTRESYALQYFEGHDHGTTEHLEELGEFTLTFYCTCKKCCGKDPSNPAYGITRSGTHVAEGRTIAVDPKVIPLGQEVYIEGFGTFTAEDTGSGVGNKHIDVYVSDHQVALNCGVAKAVVYA